MKEGIKELAKLGAKALIANTPEIINQVNKKKEEKTFFEKNKSWIFIIILSIFVTNLSYINVFENVILNSAINIIFGVIVFVLICLFLFEVKKIFKIDSKFVKFLVISLIILGIINSVYHIGYAIVGLLEII